MYFDENPAWEQVREVAIGDPVTGGVNGTVNQSLSALVNRDAELARRLGSYATSEELEEAIKDIDLSPYAPKNNPILTGIPQAPTAPQDTSNEQIATTAFVQNLIAAIKPLLCPTGTVINFAGASAPNGFLLCNGAAVSRTQYAALFAVIGTRWGAGDGSTTFNLPNAIGRFAESALKVGTYKSAGLPNITGTVGVLGVDGRSHTGAFYYHSVGGELKNSGERDYIAGFSAQRCSEVYGNSNTVQPASFTILTCIKY